MYNLAPFFRILSTFPILKLSLYLRKYLGFEPDTGDPIIIIEGEKT